MNFKYGHLNQLIRMPGLKICGQTEASGCWFETLLAWMLSFRRGWHLASEVALSLRESVCEVHASFSLATFYTFWNGNPWLTNENQALLTVPTWIQGDCSLGWTPDRETVLLVSGPDELPGVPEWEKEPKNTFLSRLTQFHEAQTALASVDIRGYFPLILCSFSVEKM